MFGFDALTAAGWLILASTMTCTVPKAPEIVINPVSAPIAYEFNLTSAQLDTFKSSTINPYAPGIDTSTGGLRHDRPVVKTEVQWGVQHDQRRTAACLWYEKITVNIELSPKIYIAREERNNKVCREAIKGHELKHVEVDRQVINQYAMDIGRAVKTAVDGAGAMGPYAYNDLAEVQERLVAHVRAAVDSRKLQLYQDMARRQAEVDSLEEYERISKICKESKR